MIYKLSCMGEHHTAVGGENQDALCSAEEGSCQIISLADGVSACRKAKTGAEIASRAITGLMAKAGKRLLGGNASHGGEQILGHILTQLKECAQGEGDDLEEYSSTVASVLLDREKGELVYFNLGDGLILGVDRGKCRVLSMPGDSTCGCCVTTTEGAVAEADMGKVSLGTTERVLICSDGAWREMYDRTRLRPEVYPLLVNGQWEKLERFFRERDCDDDYSIIALEA